VLLLVLLLVPFKCSKEATLPVASNRNWFFDVAFRSVTYCYAIRARRKSVSEKDFLDSVNKVVKGYKKFSSTPKYMVYN
jgi:hypothetical protein